MDVKTKRFLWNCLNKIRSHGKALLLTTHSMDEAEALCSKVGIMSNGELKCFGSLQNLKEKYGEGFSLLVCVKEKNCQNFVEFILTSFNECNLLENRDSFLCFHFKKNSKNNSLSRIFYLMESKKKFFEIQSYILTQASLEQIFFKFVSKKKNK